MSRITLKSLKYAAFASEETNCYEAIVCLDGVPMFHARNDGKGGADLFSNLPKQSGADFRVAFAKVDAAARADFPQFFVGEVASTGYAGLTYSMGLEALIGTFVTDELALRDLRRHLKSKVLFKMPGDKPGQFRAIKLSANATLADGVAHIRARYGAGAVVLNSMPEAEALALYTGGAS